MSPAITCVRIWFKGNLTVNSQRKNVSIDIPSFIQVVSVEITAH